MKVTEGTYIVRVSLATRGYRGEVLLRPPIPIDSRLSSCKSSSTRYQCRPIDVLRKHRKMSA